MKADEKKKLLKKEGRNTKTLSQLIAHSSQLVVLEIRKLLVQRWQMSN